jgi:callose synthase
VVSDILRYARKTKESSGGESNEDLGEQVAELRRVVQRQEQMLAGSGFSSGNAALLVAEPPSPTETPEPQPEPGRPQQSGRSYDRSVSMTGMDVWGSMAFGDTGEFSRDSSTAGTLATEGTSTSSVTQSTNQGFSFTQPDTMPPR